MHDNEKHLDGLLDSALAGYSQAEPRPGLEGRIIARLSVASASQETERTSWLRWWPAIGFAVAAIVAVAIFIAMPKSKPGNPTPEQTVVKQVAPTPSTPAVQQPTQVARLTRAPHVNAVRRSVLPQPSSATQGLAKPLLAVTSEKQEAILGSPLSDQERLLLAYLRRTPAQEIVTQAKPDEVPDVFQQPNRVQITRPSDSNLAR